MKPRLYFYPKWTTFTTQCHDKVSMRPKSFFFFPSALVGALTSGAAFSLSPLGSYLCARFGFRPTAIFGAILCATGLALCSVVSSMSLLFLSYSAIFGIGAGFVYMASTLVVIRFFVKRRALAVGIISSAACSGTLVISKMNSALLEAFGLANTFRGMAISMACILDINTLMSGEIVRWFFLKVLLELCQATH